MRRRPTVRTTPRPRRNRLSLMSFVKRQISGFNRKRKQETKRSAAMAKQAAETKTRREARRKASGSSTKSKPSLVKNIAKAVRARRDKPRTAITPRPITSRPIQLPQGPKLRPRPTTGKATIKTAKQIRKPAPKPVTVKAPAPKKKKPIRASIDPIFAKRRRG